MAEAGDYGGRYHKSDCSQLLNTLTPNSQVWVQEKKPKTCLEAGQLADDYAQARKQAEGEAKSEYVKKDSMNKQPSSDQKKGWGTGEATCTDPKDGDGGKSNPSGRGPRCYSCHKYGHVTSRCLSRVVLYGEYVKKNSINKQPSSDQEKGWGTGEATCTDSKDGDGGKSLGGWQLGRGHSAGHGSSKDYCEE